MGSEIEVHPEPTKSTRSPVPAVDLLARAAELVFEGKRPTDLARKLGVSYPHAARLYEQVYEQVYGRIRDRYTPEVLATMKDELAETLLEQVRNCRRAVARSIRDGKPNTRPYTHMNSAVKLLNQMEGFNAPTATVNLEHRSYSLVSPAVQARIMADPRARAALLALEEFAAEQEPLLPTVVEIGGGE